MDDACWCPVCDRQIVPKRTLEPVPAPPPPPPSPDDSPRRTRPSPGGLVSGTGRLRPNGSIKRAQQQPDPPPRIRMRTIIDQSPIPLYCSDECRLADIHRDVGFWDGYTPERAGPLTASPRSESPAPAPTAAPAPSAPTADPDVAAFLVGPTHLPYSPSMATLARIYGFGPLPAPAPVPGVEQPDVYDPTHLPKPKPSKSSSSLEPVASSSSSSGSEYDSGVMMAARKIRAAVASRSEQPKSAHKPNPPQEWADGSHAWRASVYSLAAPKTLAHKDARFQTPAPYNTFAATTHPSRSSKGVCSTLSPTHPSQSSTPMPSAPTAPQRSAMSYSEELLHVKYPLSSSKRSESRAALFPSASSTSVPSLSSRSRAQPPRKEVSLLPPGAEGKLLVPDVKMRAHRDASPVLAASVRSSSKSRTDRQSVSTSASGGASVAANSANLVAPGRRSSGSTTSSRPSVRSPLSRFASTSEMGEVFESPEDDMPSALPAGSIRRPGITTRSWSYDNIKTYPIMMPKEIRREKRIVEQPVEGEEGKTQQVEVEVEVEVVKPIKRLFLFADKEVVSPLVLNAASGFSGDYTGQYY